MFKVEFQNDRGDWIHRSWHRTFEHAEEAATRLMRLYNRARIIKDGKIIREVES